MIVVLLSIQGDVRAISYTKTVSIGRLDVSHLCKVHLRATKCVNSGFPSAPCGLGSQARAWPYVVLLSAWIFRKSVRTEEIWLGYTGSGCPRVSGYACPDTYKWNLDAPSSERPENRYTCAVCHSPESSRSTFDGHNRLPAEANYCRLW
jgi:hypothetical protein